MSHEPGPRSGLLGACLAPALAVAYICGQVDRSFGQPFGATLIPGREHQPKWVMLVDPSTPGNLSSCDT